MTIESLLYFGGIALWSAFIAYAILERITPKAKVAHHEPVVVREMPPLSPHALDHGIAPPPIKVAAAPSPVGKFDQNIGFKSFQQGAELTVEDIVKGLTR